MGSIATQDASNVTITGGTIEGVALTLGTALPIASGGTAATTASGARTNLGLGTLATQNGTFSGTSSGTNTGDQNLFKTISVSGQSDVVAGTTTSALTLVAGTNISITTNASTDAITINASGGASAAGSNTQVQYNGSGIFAADSGFTYSSGTITLSTGWVAGNLAASSATISSTNTNGDITLAPNGSGSVIIGKVDITGGSITGITDLVVADGGTGVSAFTAYAPVIGGTTTTGALASATSGMSNSGYVLTSTGTGSAPTWQAAAGGGDMLLSGVQTVTGAKTFNNATLILAGSSSGTSTLEAAAAAGTGVITLPTGTDTLAGLGTAQTWTAVQTVTKGDLKLLGSSTGSTTLNSGLSSTSSNTLALPITASDTLAALGTAQTWTAAQTITKGDLNLLGTSTGSTTLNSSLSSTSSNTLSLPITASDTLAAVGTVQTWTAAQTFTDGDFLLKGSSSGSMTLKAPAAASTFVATFPANTGTVYVSGDGASNPVLVTDGGTGLATLTTAYGLLFAGTTATGNVQTLSSLGSSGQVLTSQGTGTLPHWAAAAATGATLGTAYLVATAQFI